MHNNNNNNKDTSRITPTLLYGKNGSIVANKNQKQGKENHIDDDKNNERQWNCGKI